MGAEHEPLNADMAKVAAKTIEATGVVHEAPDLRALFVDEWHVVGEAAKPAKKAKGHEHHEHDGHQH